MGLSGRKVKQRIPADPRNLAWADDAAKFGSNYLSKFGWDASKGLGVEGDGRTSHIKVSHKLDMLGIGAAHQRDPNGIAWKQNKDFENLLKRLNESASPDLNPADEAVVEIKEEAVAADEDESRSDGGSAEKKRKRKEKREGKSEEKIKKRRKKDAEDEVESTESPEGVKESQEPTAPVPAKPFVPRNRAHRARAIASKAIASKSSAHIDEILGIAPTPSTTSNASGSNTPLGGKLTPLDDGTVTLEKLTTSTKSVADYFKEKLLAKSSKSGTQTPATPLPDIKLEESYDAQRGGLGAGRSGLGVKAESPDEASQRIGISQFSSLMSSTFLSSTTSFTPSDPSTETEEPASSGSDSSTKTKKEKRKKASIEDEEEETARDIKEEKKEKKRRRAKEEEVNEEGEGKHDSGDGAKSKKKEKRLETGTGDETTLSKEERRRLRRERKNREKSSP